MNKKKVAILTFFNRMNYGAELQAYALHRKVKDFGYDCEILDVLSPNDPCARKPKVYKPFQWAQKNKSIKAQINTKIVNCLTSLIGRRNERQKKAQFDKFKHAYMTVSRDKYSSVDDLYRSEMPYDIYITGSDQVWNPRSIITSPEPYFLTFAPKNKRKISYAASFGISSFPKEMKSYYKQWLENIDSISVRESEGAEFVRDISGSSAEVVLDPTLLLKPEDWDKAATEPKVKKPYILLYVLKHSSYVDRLAYYLSNKTGCRIVRLPRGNIREGIELKIENLFGQGPSEFLGLFRNASFVLTSSFHGTAFSINYNKPFYSIVRKGDKLNCRKTTLLENLGLSSRLMYFGDEFPKEDDIMMDYSGANLALQKEREKSLSFLKNALGS